ncbi:CHAP domain-containing protein [Nocardia farcinica]|uniref:CHAP domain-containing protein n=1 Tax=Nocardia farcinica TaxID=37329 RepID=UPI001894CEBF|nr:CHAP domain-containing protein [Nocardia farcinica]MBF6386377.1 CHAP domain-containing protein [Nocardia farcinica]
MTVRHSGTKAGRWLVAALALAVVAGLAVVGVRWWQGGEPAVVGERLSAFPAIDHTVLDADQRALLAVLEREFADPRPGTAYAEGARESWCADFVSWTMREAGRPLANPNSGSWRIPGVYTLQGYYESVGRFVPATDGYRPRTGDVLLYGPSSQFGQHTNIVLAAADGEVTTIGGNEFDRVAVHRFRLADVRDVVGYGRF